MANYDISVKLFGDTSNFNANFGKAMGSLKGFGGSLQGLGKGITGVGKAFAPVSVAVGAIGTKAVGTAIDFTKLYESTMIVFEKFLGGKDAADALYGSLLDVAKASTFGQEVFLENGKAMVGVGISAENTTKYMQAITDAVSAFGGESDKIDQMAFAFRKVATNGRFSMEEINMIGDSGVQALSILGNHFGKTRTEMQKMISSGAVPAEEGLEILTEGMMKGTDGINGTTQAVEGMAAALKGGTLTGALDGMNTAWRSFALNLTGINPTLKKGDEGFAESQERIKQLTAAIGTINQILPLLGKVFGGVTDAIGTFLDKLVGTEPVLDKATGTWDTAGGALGRLQTYLDNVDPSKVEWIGNAIAGIAVAAPILIITGKLISGLGKAFDTAADAATGIKDGIKTARDSIKALPATVSKARTAVVTQVNAIKTSFSTIAGSISKAKTAVQTQMGLMVTSVKTSMTNMRTSMATGFANLPSTASTAMTNMRTSVTTGMTTVRTALVTGATTAATGVRTQFIAMQTGARTALTAIGTQARIAATGLRTMATSAAAAIAPFLPLIAIAALFAAAFKYAWETDEQFRASIQESGQIIATSFAPVMEELGKAVAELAPVFADLVAQLAPVIAELAPVFAGLVAGVAPLIAMLVANLAPAIANLAPIIGNLVSQIAPFIATLVSQLAPVISQIVSTLANLIAVLAPIIAQVVGQLAPIIANIVSQLVTMLAPIIIMIVQTIQKMMPTIMQIVTTVITVVAQIIAAVLPIVTFILGIIAKILPPIIRFIAKVIQIVAKVIATIIKVVKPIIAFVVTLVTTLVTKIRTIIGKVKTIFNTVKKTIQDAFNKAWDTVKKVIDKIKNGFQTVKDAVGKVRDGVRDAFSKMVSGIKSIINRFFRGINNAIGLLRKLPGLGGLGTIPLLAQGTKSFEGGFAYIGENNRGELVNLPNGAQVIPHDVSMQYAREAARTSSNRGETVDSGAIASAVASSVMGLSGKMGSAMRESLNGTGVYLNTRQFTRAIGEITT